MFNICRLDSIVYWAQERDAEDFKPLKPLETNVPYSVRGFECIPGIATSLLLHEVINEVCKNCGREHGYNVFGFKIEDVAEAHEML